MMSSKFDYANYDQFYPNFGVACETICHAFVPNLKLNVSGRLKTVLWGKEVGKFSII